MASPMQIANSMLSGNLEQMLRAMRDKEGLSLQKMAERLQAMNIDASKEQVRRWCIELKIPTTRVKADA